MIGLEFVDASTFGASILSSLNASISKSIVYFHPSKFSRVNLHFLFQQVDSHGRPNQTA